MHVRQVYYTLAIWLAVYINNTMNMPDFLVGLGSCCLDPVKNLNHNHNVITATKVVSNGGY